jgi:hypothetical protein
MATSLKKHKAGLYSLNEYYTYKMEDSGVYRWTVGIKDGSGNNTWIEDFKTYKAARAFILRQIAKVGA